MTTGWLPVTPDAAPPSPLAAEAQRSPVSTGSCGWGRWGQGCGCRAHGRYAGSGWATATAQQWPPASPEDHAGQRMAPQEQDAPSASVGMQCWSSRSSIASIPKFRDVNELSGASFLGSQTNSLHCHINERHNADYNPRATFTIQAATSWLDLAEAAMTSFLQTSRSERAAEPTPF